MCGISGILGPGNQMKQESIVRAMMERLKHRGPDGNGLHQGKGFCFGHQRLSIIDLEHGRQPMISEDGRYSLIFNGEIYNYIELRKSLESEGVRFHTHSDTEVLLQMLIQKNVEALLQLNGMFAFAFHDKETGQWMLVRDPFGIKPLYYCIVGDEIVFASEIKALLEHPEVQAERNWPSMQHYLTFQFYFGEQTLFKGINEVQPGFYLKGNDGQLDKIARYWDISYQINTDESEKFFKEELISLLMDSVRMQIRSDVSLGSHLSGGIDSSMVASLAAKHFDDKISVFTGKFSEGGAYDESYYAKLVAEEINAHYYEVTPTANQFVEYLPKLIYFLDQPLAGPGLFPQYLVSQLASQHVKVVLGGQGGDEIFGGYARYLIGYLEQALKGAIFETQEEGKHVVTLASIIENLSILKEYQPLMQRFWKDGLFDNMDLRYYKLIDRSPEIFNFLSQDTRASFDKEEVFSEFQAVFNYPDTSSYINKMTYFDQKTILPALLHVEDRVSMAVSLESRVPLLDTRIVNLASSMPPKIKFNGGRTKHIFKEAAKNFIPRSIIARKDKMGFPVPLNKWINNGVVKEFVSDIMLGKTSRERGLFNIQKIDNLINNEQAFGRELWGVLSLELWHRKFIDSN